MRALFDTNVVLDVLLQREPYADVATELMSLVDSGRLEGFISATTVTTIHYLAARAVGTGKAAELMGTLLDVFQVAPVDREVIAGALELRFADFEDAVIHEAAVFAEATVIVTRNGRDIRDATIAVFDPNEMLAAVHAAEAFSLADDAAKTYSTALRQAVRLDINSTS